MFITSIGGYDRHGQQWAKGQFLVLMEPDDTGIGVIPENVRGLVVRTHLRQLGHFMMGSARVAGQSLTLSGAYGHDGLIMTVPRQVWERGTPLPRELYDAWNTGGGWNSAGSEAEAMRVWAKTLPGYRQPRRS